MKMVQFPWAAMVFTKVLRMARTVISVVCIVRTEME